MNHRRVVYTAIFGGSDRLHEPAVVEPGCDYVCFTDDLALKSAVWDIRRPHMPFADSRRNARMLKILAHRHFADYEYSIWLDGTFTLLCPPGELIERYLDEDDFAAFKHPRRNCLYDEALACIQMGKDDPLVLFGQARAYMSDGYPPDNGLIYSGIVLRRHSPLVAETCELWWQELARHSKRDQVSFNYVDWKTGLTYAPLAGSWRVNPHATYSRHLDDQSPARGARLPNVRRRAIALALQVTIARYKACPKTPAASLQHNLQL